MVALCDRLAAYQTIDKSTNTGTAELSAIHQVSDDNDDASTDIATTADEDESFSDEMSQVA